MSDPVDAIARLLAIEDIRQLKARYFRHVDAKEWDALAALFAVDATFHHSHGRSVRDPWTGEYHPPLAAEPRISRGRETIIAAIRAAVENVRTIHHGHMPEIEITGPDSARGVWAMTDELRDREGRLILAGAGHYAETYLIEDGAWRFATVSLSRLWVTEGDGRRG